MIALQRIALMWPDRCGIEIEVPSCGVGAPAGSLPINGFAEAVTAATSDDVPLLSFVPDPEAFFEPVRLRENGRYAISIVVPVPRGTAEAESQRARDAGVAWPFLNPRLREVVTFTTPRHWHEDELGGQPVTTITGFLNPGSHVGVVDLTVSHGHPFRVEVASNKMSYFDDVRAMLDAIAENILEMVLSIDSVGGLRFAESDPSDAPTSVALFHLRRIMRRDELPAAVDSIVSRAQTRLVEEMRLLNPTLAAPLDLTRLVQRASRLNYVPDGPLARPFGGRTPTEVPAIRRRDSVDTPENRYVKAFLEDLLAFVLRLERLLARESRTASQREALAWADWLEDALSADMWRDVGQLRYFPSNSQVLLRGSGYRDVLQADLLMQYGLILPWRRATEISETIGDIRPIFELYEYWCFFQLRSVLRDICGSEESRLGSFYTSRAGSLEISLRQGRRSRLTFNHKAYGQPIVVSLFYNRGFQRRLQHSSWSDGSYSGVFRPDYSIHIQTEDRAHWLHFDAKYRLDFEEWVDALGEDDAQEVETELTRRSAEGTYKKADLHKVHAYRDALLGCRGAYLFFPGATSTPSLFVRSPDPAYRNERSVPSVGAFPLRPRADTAQIVTLRAFIDAAIADLCLPDATYVEETGVKANL